MNYLKILFLVIFPISSFAQLEGDWYGMVDFGSVQIPIVLHVQKDTKEVTLDSPDQQAFGMKSDSLFIDEGKIYFQLKGCFHQSLQSTLAARHQQKNGKNS